MLKYITKQKGSLQYALHPIPPPHLHTTTRPAASSSFWHDTHVSIRSIASCFQYSNRRGSIYISLPELRKYQNYTDPSDKLHSNVTSYSLLRPKTSKQLLTFILCLNINSEHCMVAIFILLQTQSFKNGQYDVRDEYYQVFNMSKFTYCTCYFGGYPVSHSWHWISQMCAELNKYTSNYVLGLHPKV